MAAEGAETLWSDLYTIGFDHAERASHYDPANAFDPLQAQSDASDLGALPDDVIADIDKIRAADRIILHVPLWWFAPPAMIKGWADRCPAHGALHTSEYRFDTGLCRGKEVLFGVTTGASSDESAANGKEGDTRLHLWPLA